MACLDENIVIVIDTSNYKAEYAEETPFKAKVVENYEHECLVKSITTGKEYELYSFQILESLSIKEIKEKLA